LNQKKKKKKKKSTQKLYRTLNKFLLRRANQSTRDQNFIVPLGEQECSNSGKETEGKGRLLADPTQCYKSWAGKKRKGGFCCIREGGGDAGTESGNREDSLSTKKALAVRTKRTVRNDFWDGKEAGKGGKKPKGFDSPSRAGGKRKEMGKRAAPL